MNSRGRCAHSSPSSNRSVRYATIERANDAVARTSGIAVASAIRAASCAASSRGSVAQKTSALSAFARAGESEGVSSIAFAIHDETSSRSGARFHIPERKDV